MLCATMWTRPPFGASTMARSTLLQVVAGIHRAVAVVGVVEQSGPRRPGEQQGLAVELDAVGEIRGIERCGLERLLEAVHVDQDVTAGVGSCEQIARLFRHGRNVGKTPAVEAGRGEREAAFAGWLQLGAGDRHGLPPVRPEPGCGAPAVHPLARGGDAARSDLPRATRRRSAGPLRRGPRSRRAQARSPTSRARRQTHGETEQLRVAANVGSRRTFGNVAPLTRPRPVKFH